MKITILGSGAAEAIPALWCECDTCRQAKAVGGRDIRRRTSYLIDDDTLVDFGPDAFQQSVQFNIDWRAIRRILFTHAHEDHLNPVELRWRQPGFSRVPRPIRIFGTRDVMARIRKEVPYALEALQIEAVEIRAGEAVADGDMEIFPIRATHAGNDGQCVNFIIRRDGKQVLIANDTGWWEPESWAWVAGFRLDAAIIECTMGLVPRFIDCRNGHLGANVSVEFRDKLLELGAISRQTPVYVNHFSHNGVPLHADICRFFEPRGIGVGYDGLELSV